MTSPAVICLDCRQSRVLGFFAFLFFSFLNLLQIFLRLGVFVTAMVDYAAQTEETTLNILEGYRLNFIEGVNRKIKFFHCLLSFSEYVIQTMSFIVWLFYPASYSWFSYPDYEICDYNLI